jgi:hypothetical protein
MLMSLPLGICWLTLSNTKLNCFNFYLYTTFSFFIVENDFTLVNMETNILSQYELPKDTQGTQGNIKAKCRLCPAYISGSLKVTSNFKTDVKVC